MLAAALAALTALAVPGVAHAQTIDNGLLAVDLNGLGGLQVTYLGQPQLFDEGGGLWLRSDQFVSPSGPGDRTQIGTTTVQGMTATSTYDVPDMSLRVVETDSLASGSRDLTRSYEITNTGDTAIDLHAGELGDAYIGGSDEGRGVMPPGPPRLVGGLSPNGQLSGLVEVTPWTRWQESEYSDIFADFARGSLRTSIDPNYTDNGLGAEWDFTLQPGEKKEPITVIWRFDAAMRVNSTADHDDGKCDPLTDTTDCTLRDAIVNAPGGSVISVPAGTYQLDPKIGELKVADRTLTVYGAGASVGQGSVIDGSGGTRALEVASGGNLTLSGFRLQNGNGTFGVPRAPLQAVADLANGSGGAALVQEGGALELQDSEVAGNTASIQGGGIATGGTLTLLRSTVADNTAGDETGGAQGGGLYVSSTGTAVALDSTIGDNVVYGSGGAAAVDGQLQAFSATIAGNRIAGTPPSGAGHGVTTGEGASITARNSILAGDAPVCGGTPPKLDTDFDIVSDKSCNLPGAKDQQGVDPNLGALTINPPASEDTVQTDTFALGDASPAIDAGDNASCRDPRLAGIDQLGQPRVMGQTCDIGSVERAREIPSPVILSPADGSTVGTSAVTFSGTAEPGDEVDVYDLEEGASAQTTADASGNWSATTEPPLPDGTYRFVAFACDQSSDSCSSETDPVTVTIDTSAPPAPAIVSAPASSGSTVTLSGTASPGSTIDVYDNGTRVATTGAPNGTWSVTLTGVAPGTHRYTAVARDAAGNASPASPPRDVVVTQPQQATPTPTPTPTPTATPTPLPPPVKGTAVNAQTKSGTIRIKLPGTNTFVELGPGQQIPVGTTVDATHGRITLTAAGGRPGQTQHADFYQGIFRVTQSKGRTPVTQLALAGPQPTCTTHGRRHRARASAARKSTKKRVKTRKLWGNGHGSFRTKGKYSSATVRGTTWLTQDSCAGTLTRVTHGVVRVRDFRRHKNVIVRAGHRYLARAKRR